MSDALKELRKGNIEIFENMDEYQKNYAMNLLANADDQKEILATILPKFMIFDEWYGVEHDIFHFIYMDDTYREYTYYLLHSEKVCAEELYYSEVKNLCNKNWGLDYLLKNLEKLTFSKCIGQVSLSSLLVEEIKEDDENYKRCLDTIFSLKNNVLREFFIRNSIERKERMDEKFILASLYENPDDFFYHQECLEMLKEEKRVFYSEIPFVLSTKSRYHSFILEYPELFFEAEENNKLAFLSNMKHLSLEIDKRCEVFKKIYEKNRKKNINGMDYVISSVLNANEDAYILDYIKNKRVKYEDRGTTSIAFKVGKDQIIKLSTTKHNHHSIEKHFLIAPTDRKTIYDSNGNIRAYIERQDYLKKTYDGQKMTVEDVEHFLEEAKRCGLNINDPHCKDKEFDNFGFLKSYKDASLVGVSSHEELPEWFKKRPIVLYDVDMVTYMETPSDRKLTLTK